MSPSQIRLAALDMAGTTVDEGGAVYVALAVTVESITGRPVDDADLARWMGADKREAITGLLRAAGAPRADIDLDDAFAEFSARLDEAYASAPPTPMDGIEAAFAELRTSGVSVYLTTGFSDRVANGVVEALGWQVGATIDGLVTAEQVGAGRPSPRMVQRAMEQAGVLEPDQVLVAGDTLRDLEAGANARAGLVVGVLTGAHDAATLAAGPSTHVIASARELPRLIASSRPVRTSPVV